MDNLITKHGVPAILYSDQGASYLSTEFKHFLDSFGIQQETSQAYYHNANGLVERMNRSLRDMMSAYTSQMEDDWDHHIQAVTWCYNTAVHTTTGYSPFEIIHGRRPRHSIDRTIADVRNPLYVDNPNATMVLKLHLEAIRAIAKERLIVAAERQKTQHDASRRTRPITLTPGDWVLLREGGAKHLNSAYTGPHYLKEIDPPNAVIVVNEFELQKVHLNRLKKYHPREVLEPPTGQATKKKPSSDDVRRQEEEPPTHHYDLRNKRRRGRRLGTEGGRYE